MAKIGRPKGKEMKRLVASVPPEILTALDARVAARNAESVEAYDRGRVVREILAAALRAELRAIGHAAA